MGRFQKLDKKGATASAVDVPLPSLPTGEVVAREQYASFVTQGDDAFFSGRCRDALRHYSRALQADSTNIYPWVGQLNALLELRQYKEAAVWSARALELFPEEPTLLSQRARVLAHNGDTRRAIGASDYAMNKGASSEWAWLARGDVLLLAHNPNSRFCLAKAIETAGPDNWRVPFVAGLLEMREKNFPAAVEFLEIATQRNLSHAYTWFKLAQALDKLNFVDRAREAAARAHELDPTLRKDSTRLRDDIGNRSFFERMLGFLRR